MLKVLLVDDEDIIREGLFYNIEWESLGFTVAGQAEDGEQALEIVQKVHPDIIITDIKMPFMDGLELIEHVKSMFPKTYIIIISGHDEFHYAQKALKLGADDYILKPIDLEYLTDNLLKLKADYEWNKKKESEVNVLKEKVDESTPLLKEHFLKDMVLGRTNAHEALCKLKNYDDIDCYNCYHVVMIVQIDNFYILTKDMEDEQKRAFSAAFYEFVRNSVENDQEEVAFMTKSSECVICVSDKHKEPLKNKVDKLCGKIRGNIRTTSQYSVTIAIGDVVNSMQLLEHSYKQAEEALDYKFIIGENQDIYYNKIDFNSNESGNRAGYIDYDDTELVSSIKFTDKTLIKKSLKELAENIRNRGKNSYLYTQILISSIYRQALRILKEVGGSAEEVFTNPIEAYRSIMTHQTVEGMINELLNVLIVIADYIDAKRLGKSTLIEKAKEYIRKNYADSHLSLEDVANCVNMSVSYFSIIFKQETGYTFIDYLTNIRMEKAKEILKAGYKSYEASYMVGYNNPTYFSTIFKKYTGVSPTQYVKSCTQ